VPHALWPVDPGALLPFLAAVALIEITPGPNMGYLAALSAAQGRAAGLRAVAGVTLGLAAYMLAAVFGVAQLLAASPLIYALLRWAGVLYLLYLAWEAWRGVAETSPGHTGATDHAPFWRGLIANLLNPKALVFYVALLPGFIELDHGPFWSQALIFGCAHLIVSVIIHGGIVFGADRAGVLLRRASNERMVHRALAIAIGLTAVWLAWSTRMV
jgi:threonine/homoserine/homoserine lactone efflux protein